MPNILSAYSPQYPRTLVYMLQSSEYRTQDYISWLHRTTDFSAVAKRRQLDMTTKARALLIVAMTLFFGLLLLGLLILCLGIVQENLLLCALAAGVVLVAPMVTAYSLIVPLVVGYHVVQKPRQMRIIEEARLSLEKYPATKIAIAGSYGKTTFREQLLAVFAAVKKTAATPGNYNTPIGISRFVGQLEGDEEILIFEFGEHYPGDIKELCELVEPDIGIITGINESHLEKFGAIENTVATIFELQDYLGNKPLYKNIESDLVAARVQDDDRLIFNQEGADGWVVSDVSSTILGTNFIAKKGPRTVKATSKLLGVHMVGVIVASIAIAESLGLSDEQIERGIAAARPFKHRMEPRETNGALLLDDTYNGNIDGVKSGLALLKKSEASRRIYVTPGLVEQGEETVKVHQLMGRLIADAADKVYLMKNSTTVHIEQGLKEANFQGELTLVDDPLEFYTELDHFVAKGDVVLMQNDWTDNYH